MKHSVFVAIGSPAIRPHHSFRMVSCALPSLLMLLLSLSLGAGQAWPQCGSLGGPSTTWSDGNGAWGAAGNWTSGTPSPTTNACILDGTSTVTLDTNGNAFGLQLATGNSLNINAGVSLSLASVTSLNYGTVTNGGTLTNTSGAYLTNYGLIIISGGTVTSSRPTIRVPTLLTMARSKEASRTSAIPARSSTTP
jgi:hypothetical protein